MFIINKKNIEQGTRNIEFRSIDLILLHYSLIGVPCLPRRLGRFIIHKKNIEQGTRNIEFRSIKFAYHILSLKMNIEHEKTSLFPCCALPSRSKERWEMGFKDLLGNDIIDWETAKPQTHKLRQRSLEKLFNLKEIQYIKSQQDPMLAYWQLWSVKESAYKAWQRLNQTRPVFNPKRFLCCDIQQDIVCVAYDDFQCKVMTLYTKDYIYSQCDSEECNYHIFYSEVSYRDWLSELLKQDWILEKSEYNIPNFFNTKTQKTVPVSITKDFDYVGVAW